MENDIEQIKEILQSKRFFPEDASLWGKGEPVYEFPFIERINDSRFVVHIQRHYAWNSYEMAEHAEFEFNNLKKAVKKFNKLNAGKF